MVGKQGRVSEQLCLKGQQMQPEQNTVEHYLRMFLQEVVGEVMASDQGGTLWHLGDMVLGHDVSSVGSYSDMNAHHNQP
jgi:NADPH:quinone reductase-like Zn-dependent oxidoreductase